MRRNFYEYTMVYSNKREENVSVICTILRNDFFLLKKTLFT